MHFKSFVSVDDLVGSFRDNLDLDLKVSYSFYYNYVKMRDVTASYLF